jgi:putative nucleotidyltransferase-like protein
VRRPPSPASRDGSPIPELGAAERELLLLCGRLELDAVQRGRLEELVTGLRDWSALVFYARAHSVASLLHLHLARTSGYENIPTAARGTLLALSHRAAYHGRCFAQEHADLVERFERAGIEAIAPKGLPLVELVYGSHALRPLIDLVYLVRPGQLHAVARLMREPGYRQLRVRALDQTPAWVCPQATLAVRREIPVTVLLIGGLGNWPRLHRLRLEELFSRSERAVVGGADSRVLSPADLVLYLCLQADNHGYFNRVALGSVDPVELLLAAWSNNRLVRFVDLRESVRLFAERLDWADVVERARAGGVAEAVHVSLGLTEALLGSVAPAGVRAELDVSRRHLLRGWLFRAVAQDRAEDERNGLERFARDRWLGRAARRQLRLARLLGLAEVAFPDLSTLRARYPRMPGPALVPGYPLHAVRAVGASAASFLVHGFRGVAARLRPTRIQLP